MLEYCAIYCNIIEVLTKAKKLDNTTKYHIIKISFNLSLPKFKKYELNKEIYNKIIY